MLLVVDPQILKEINENERDILITIYYQSVLAIFNFFTWRGILRQNRMRLVLAKIQSRSCLSPI